MKAILCAAFASLCACDDHPCPTPNPHEIARDKRGCVTMQVGCKDLFYTHCDGKSSTTDTECHWVQEGKIGHEECSSSTTSESDTTDNCCPESNTKREEP